MEYEQLQHLQDKGEIPNPIAGSVNFSTLGWLVSPESLLIYFYENTGLGKFLTFDINNFQIKKSHTKDSNLRILNLILDQTNQRLFYTSTYNQFYTSNQIGVFNLKDGGVDQIIYSEEIMDNITKLVLLPDNCHMLALTQSPIDSVNGSLVIYKINDPEIGCGTDWNKISLGISITASATLLAIAVIITGGICYWLKKQGAKKGYMPIGGD